MRSLTVISFVCALFVAIIHAQNANNADDGDAQIPPFPKGLPQTLRKMSSQAKAETKEEAEKRKAFLTAVHNKQMADGGDERPARRRPAKPKIPLRDRNPAKDSPPRSKVRLTAAQIEEIDMAKKAAKRRNAVAMKHAANKRRDEEQLDKQVQQLVKESKSCQKDPKTFTATEKATCERLKLNYDTNNDGRADLVEITEKTEKMMEDMRAAKTKMQLEKIRPTSPRKVGEKSERPRRPPPPSVMAGLSDPKPRSPSKEDLKKRRNTARVPLSPKMVKQPEA